MSLFSCFLMKFKSGEFLDGTDKRLMRIFIKKILYDTCRLVAFLESKKTIVGGKK